jgi:hypothetical protein
MFWRSFLWAVLIAFSIVYENYKDPESGRKRSFRNHMQTARILGTLIWFPFFDMIQRRINRIISVWFGSKEATPTPTPTPKQILQYDTSSGTLSVSG